MNGLLFYEKRRTNSLNQALGGEEWAGTNASHNGLQPNQTQHQACPQHTGWSLSPQTTNYDSLLYEEQIYIWSAIFALGK